MYLYIYLVDIHILLYREEKMAATFKNEEKITFTGTLVKDGEYDFSSTAKTNIKKAQVGLQGFDISFEDDDFPVRKLIVDTYNININGKIVEFDVSFLFSPKESDAELSTTIYPAAIAILEDS